MGLIKLVALLGDRCPDRVYHLSIRRPVVAAKLGRERIRASEFQSNHPYLVYGVAFFIYVAVTGLSLPGCNWIDPRLRLVLWVLAGPCVDQLCLDDWRYDRILDEPLSAQRHGAAQFGDKLKSFNEQLEKEGAFYLFTLRLIPAFPFFMINLVMGLTPLKARTYYWVSQLGMLPGTAVYVYAGSRVPNLSTLAEKGAGAVFSPSQLTQLLIAFGLLGAFPLAVKKIMNRFPAVPSPAT